MEGAHAINADRLWGDIMALAAITDPARPFTRRSFSPLFLQGRGWLRARFEDAGLATRIDAAGNMVGRRAGSQPALGTIAIGSHSDTVPSGGRFDGIAGVAAALEIARVLRDQGRDLRHALEIVDFLAEEPSEYGLSCVGSRGMTGMLDEAMLSLTDAHGETLRDAIARVGGQPDRLGEARPDDWRAFFELHIEQSVVLERSATNVGLVTSIAGIRRLELVFEGVADHAGTTPMDLRRDALVAAARTIAFVRAHADRVSRESNAFFVATIGALDVLPNAANIVPARCRLVVDVRTGDCGLTEAFTTALDAESQRFAHEARVDRATFKILSNGAPVDCDPTLREELRASAATLGFSAIPLASGAGHDAAFASRLCPAAMLFIPCRDGKSHAPEEWADRDALAAGAAVILEALTRADVRLAGTPTSGAF